MTYFKRRWACAALMAALSGTAVQAEDEIVLPAPPDVSTLPVIVIPAVAVRVDAAAPPDVKPVAIPEVPILPVGAAEPVPPPPPTTMTALAAPAVTAFIP